MVLVLVVVYLMASLPSSQFVLGTSAGDSDDRFIYDQSEGNLFFDVDGVDSQEPMLATNTIGCS